MTPWPTHPELVCEVSAWTADLTDKFKAHGPWSERKLEDEVRSGPTSLASLGFFKVRIRSTLKRFQSTWEGGGGGGSGGGTSSSNAATLGVGTASTTMVNNLGHSKIVLVDEVSSRPTSATSTITGP